MGRLSSINTLPPEIKAELDRHLALGHMTLDGLVDYLEIKGHNVSRSALGRYRKDFDKVAEKLRESREVAAAFARELGTVPNDEMGQMLVEMVRTLAFKAALNRTDDTDLETKEVMQLARALKDLAGSEQIATKLAMEIRAEERKRLMDEQKAKLETAQKEGGLSLEAAKEARRILGFDND